MTKIYTLTALNRCVINVTLNKERSILLLLLAWAMLKKLNVSESIKNETLFGNFYNKDNFRGCRNPKLWG